MASRKRTPGRGLRTPIGNRIKVLIMIDPDVAADIKGVAIEENRAAWTVMEDAAREYLRRRKRNGRTPLP